jgi:dihydrolipoamide dehydrogenase
MASGKAMIEGNQTGWVKIVADRALGQVLGVHIIGPHATELIAEATLAVQLECTCEELARTVHAHPTLSEAIAEAAHAGLGAAIHF